MYVYLSIYIVGCKKVKTKFQICVLIKKEHKIKTTFEVTSFVQWVGFVIQNIEHLFSCKRSLDMKNIK